MTARYDATLYAITLPIAEVTGAAAGWLRMYKSPHIELGQRRLLTPAQAQLLPERLRPSFWSSSLGAAPVCFG